MSAPSCLCLQPDTHLLLREHDIIFKRIFNANQVSISIHFYYTHAHPLRCFFTPSRMFLIIAPYLVGAPAVPECLDTSALETSGVWFILTSPGLCSTDPVIYWPALNGIALTTQAPALNTRGCRRRIHTGDFNGQRMERITTPVLRALNSELFWCKEEVQRMVGGRLGTLTDGQWAREDLEACHRSGLKEARVTLYLKWGGKLKVESWPRPELM